MTVPPIRALLTVAYEYTPASDFSIRNSYKRAMSGEFCGAIGSAATGSWLAKRTPLLAFCLTLLRGRPYHVLSDRERRGEFRNSLGHAADLPPGSHGRFFLRSRLLRFSRTGHAQSVCLVAVDQAARSFTRILFRLALLLITCSYLHQQRVRTEGAP